MKKGDVVLMRQPLGRIVDTFPGKDGHTQVVKVQCVQKTYLRPAHKLVPLNIEQGQSQTHCVFIPNVGRGNVEK